MAIIYEDLIPLSSFRVQKLNIFKKASVLEDQKYGILCPNKLEIANLCPYLMLTSRSLANARLFNNNI